MQMVNVYAYVHELYSFKSKCIDANELLNIQLWNKIKMSMVHVVNNLDGMTRLRWVAMCQSSLLEYHVDFINEIRRHR